jgi:hypothetical protein
MVGLLDPDGADQWDLAGSDASPYVMAQGAFGSRVPADTMMDSPQFTQEPGVAPGPPVQSSRDLAREDLTARRNALVDQLDALNKQIQGMPQGDAKLTGVMDQFLDTSRKLNGIFDEFQQSSAGQFGKRMLERSENRGADADTIMNAIQNRQAQPRQPLPSPAPGGAPYAPAPALIAPQAPPTSGLTSFNDPVPQYLRTALAQLAQRRA